MARRENILKSLEEKSLRFIAMINDEKTYQLWSFFIQVNFVLSFCRKSFDLSGFYFVGNYINVLIAKTHPLFFAVKLADLEKCPNFCS